VIGCFMFGVPFIFVVSEYILAARASRVGSVTRVCRRQLIPFAFWLAFCLLWFHPTSGGIRASGGPGFMPAAAGSDLGGAAGGLP
jgi:fucose 4-O-acetylase-like acetyltransferase